MKIYVDADGFPRAAKDILLRAALRLGVSVVFVANKPFRQETSPLIFVDDGGVQGKTQGGWTVTFQNSPHRWWDPPSARHGDGTTFSFATVILNSIFLFVYPNIYP